MSGRARTFFIITAHCSTESKERSPFSLLSGKSVGPNNFWLRQFEIVGVGVTIGPRKWAESAPNRRAKIHPNTDIFTMSGAKNFWPNHFVPTIGENVYWKSKHSLIGTRNTQIIFLNNGFFEVWTKRAPLKMGHICKTCFQDS